MAGTINVTAVDPAAVDVVTIQLPGSPGPAGAPGATGDPGPANVLTIGTVTTLAAGSNAGATISGVSPNQVLNLSIPQGLKGDTGAVNTLTIGTVNTVAFPTAGSATITGTAPNQVLNLVLPAGPGVPAAELAGDVLVKNTDSDNDTKWETPTNASDASTLVRRTANGQASFNQVVISNAAPTLPGHGTRKDYVDSGDATTLSSAEAYADTQDAANLTTAKSYADTQDAANLTTAKSYADSQDAALGASAATASKLIRRDANGRAQVVDPAVSADIATKNYVDTTVGTGTAGDTAATPNTLVKRDANGATALGGLTIHSEGYQGGLSTSYGSVNGQANTVTLSLPILRLTGQGDASLTSTGHAFQVGDTAGINMIIDANEIIARDNGVASSLHLESNTEVVVPAPINSSDAATKSYVDTQDSASRLAFAMGAVVFTGNKVTSSALINTISVPAVNVPTRITFWAMGESGFDTAAQTVAWIYDSIPGVATNIVNGSNNAVYCPAAQWSAVNSTVTYDLPAGSPAGARLLSSSSGNVYNRGTVTWFRVPLA